ncbi:hypothetical protein N657DRAFT_678969 [Parathielavia appendiculata]|uniref:Uncharacterized protein n=1 Tax=Parathielavia appendiculata TaxID=2587402 RepID=A0AAN6Z5G3_9PEZI|nr:hypothetical protein N657DRAFT_678969 [Parathielavia appendiculata]
MISDATTSTLAQTILSDYSTFIIPVTVTAGLKHLSGNGEATAGTSAGKTTATLIPPTTAATPTNSVGSATSAATSANPVSSSSTGGMPQITQNAVMVGAAALVGGAMLL